MDNENKSGDGTKHEKASPGAGNPSCKNPEDPFPPKLSRLRWCIFIATCLFGSLCLIYVTYQLCFQYFWPSYLPSCRCCTYFALGFLFILPIIVSYLWKDILVHKARIEDQSEVEVSFRDANSVEPRLTELEALDKYKIKKDRLQKEVDRLTDIGNRGWTEYQVLPLSRMLVDFLKEDELKARARLNLAELEEYADDSAIRYDWEQYLKWKDTIDKAIKKIDEQKDDNASEKDKVSEELRAEMRTLLEHIISYKYSWASGSMLVRILIVVGVIAIPVLLLMGLLPLLHPNGEKVLDFYNWGILGIIGAIAAVLMNLRNSNVIEVGNTEGRRELSRTIIGVCLGLVAGILVYSMIAGGILQGKAFPKVTNGKPGDIPLSIFWAIASGYSFEWVFDRMRATMGERNQ